ncbi:hypothetical protein BTJ39_13590 [Izhakiella australiensis]|uniref:protein adenylyltransferase n=1 Tax=Izhakiella australiensis TaxID=1926881 RepID=A0A1S8YJS6_9GAMM|nr:Fic family protein [Izhakiella australiensis]OON39311.1 hypothetical protein BTJ39_13590 [Izhakiella australiensis]
MATLTDKQKQNLWQQRCADNLLASLQLTGTTLALGAFNPGMPHLCALHQALYGEVLDDAGELRVTDIQRFDIPCCHFEYLEQQGNALMASLEEEARLELLSAESLATRLAWFYCELSVLSPFRRGNGRTLRLFLEQLIIHAGYDVQWRKTNGAEWDSALQQGIRGDSKALAAILQKVINIPQ